MSAEAAALQPSGSSHGDESAPSPQLLLEPREGIPTPVAAAVDLDEVIDRFAAGSGPVAVDAERASGYRYSQRAYLVQLRRQGAGTVLIDPIGCQDLSGLGDVLTDVEWVLHAANQDLPCLAEIGLRPNRLFDTELAGRLLGYPRVGLGTMVEALLNIRLEKEHSASDWSRRPLPRPWLAYAALDVEVLVELRNALADALVEAGKWDWAQQEFAAIVTAPPPTPRADPWRRTSGIHRVRTGRQLAIVRALWTERDQIARQRDITPTRVLPDSAIVAAAVAEPATPAELLELPVFGGRATRRYLNRWWRTINNAQKLSAHALPATNAPRDALPPTNRWAEREPEAAIRLAAARAALTEIATELKCPLENLLPPDAVRKAAWSPPTDLSAAGLAEFLAQQGARRWQLELTADVLTQALKKSAA